MNEIIGQREIANEISEAISNPLNAGIDLDEVGVSSTVLPPAWMPYRLAGGPEERAG